MNKYFVLCIVLLSLGCANPGTPGGGPKDMTPPVLTETYPPNYSTHFKVNKFVMEFDEYVRLNGGVKAVSVSPLLKNNPTILQYGKEIEIQFESDTLLPNTTYTFSFGKNLVDNNESNPLLNLKYVFSTGDVIDSLKVSGTVTEVQTNAPLKGTKVMMYKVTKAKPQPALDSLVLTTKPNYFFDLADTNFFEIQNVSNGIYYLVALKESDDDYLLTQGKDYIGRHSQLIELTDSVSVNMDLYPTEETFKSFPASFSRSHLVTFPFRGNHEPRQIIETDSNFIPLAKVHGSLHFNSKLDTAFYWLNKKSKAGSLLYFLSYIPTQKAIDSHTVNRRNLITKPLSISTNKVQELLRDSLFIQANYPITSWFKDSIQLVHQDSIPIRKFDLKLDSIDPRILHVQFKVLPKSKYQLTFAPKSLSSAYNTLKDRVVYNYTTQEMAKYGTVKFRFKKSNWETNQYLLGIYNKAGQQVREELIQLDKANHFEHHLRFLPQAFYTFKLFADLNNDRHWTTGNYFKHTNPEPIYFYSDTLEVKSNWDIVQDWNLDNSDSTPKN